MKVTLSVAASPLAGSHLLTAICSPEAQVTSVQFYVDSQPKGTPDTSPPFTYLWDTTTVPDGTHYIEAKASFERSRSAWSLREQREVLNAGDPQPQPQDKPALVTLPVIGGEATEGKSLTVSLGDWTNEPDSFTRQWLRCGGGGYAAEVLADSPVAWWRMDDLDDSSANSNTLTVVGSVPTIAGLIAGDASLGRNFTNSTSNYLTAAHHTSLNLGDTFTLEAWLKMTALPGSGAFDMLISKGNNAYELGINGTTNLLSCGKSDVGAFVLSSIALTAGVVYHVVVTKAAGTAKLYINGVDRTGTTTAQTLANNTEILALGRYNETANFPFNGILDEVALYSTALSAARALAHYNAGASTHTCSPIPSATGVSYALANADVGSTIRVAVTAYNEAGASPTVETAETGVVAALTVSAPTIQTPPSVTGNPVSGSTLTCSNGQWQNFPDSYAYQWKRCNSSGGSCVNVGSNANTYVLTASDVGSTIKCSVTAHNSAGDSLASDSNLTALITAGSSPPTGSYIWSSDAYAGALSPTWSGEQEYQDLDDRIQFITPPAGVGGGPRNRAKIARFRINSGDDWGGNNRAEVLRQIADNPFQGRSCQGSEIWMGWETFFGQPGAVAEESVFRPRSAETWNTFLQWHPGNPGSPDFMMDVDTRAGSTAASWRFSLYHTGGVAPTGSPNEHLDLGPFSYGWHEFRVYVKWGQGTAGNIKIWIDNAPKCNWTGNVGFSNYSCHYLKQGYYRRAEANNSTIFHAGLRLGTTESIILA